MLVVGIKAYQWGGGVSGCMYRRGVAKERELVDLFWSFGWAAVRVPGSGGNTNHPLPDLIAGNGKHYMAIQIKYSKKDIIYIKKFEIDCLEEFSSRFGCLPLVGVRFNREEWFFLRPEQLVVSRGGNTYKVAREQVKRDGVDLHTLLGDNLLGRVNVGNTNT